MKKICYRYLQKPEGEGREWVLGKKNLDLCILQLQMY